MTTFIRDFFWFCAGINRRLLLECEIEFSKYFAIGATVFFTACFAAVSGAYALFFVFSGSSYAAWAAVGFGILWGLTIFNIDRYLVISIKKEGKPSKEFITALPRILLAIMIGVVIARPLELKIFDKEIKEGLKQYYLKNQEQLIETKTKNFEQQYLAEFNELSQRKREKHKSDSIKNVYEVFRDEEFFGTKTTRTTGIPGAGKQWDRRDEQVNQSQTIIDSLDKRIKYLEKFLQIKRTESGLTITTSIDNRTLDSIVSTAGFYDRNKILGQISAWTPWSFLSFKSKEYTTIPNNNSPPESPKKQLTIQQIDGENDKTVFFISMLIILIECLPIIVKLMSKRGTYDMKLEEEEERIQFLTRHETYANKHLIQQLALSQREVLTKAIEQWEENELNDENLGRRYVNQNDRNLHEESTNKMPSL